MGLRCLVGHAYGEPQVSRNRRQRGSEVVVTVREYRECRRCGHRRLISENKEVTADTPPEPSDERSAQAARTSDEVERDAADRPTGSFPVTATDLPDVDQEPLTAAEDDGIILDDEPEPTRGHGEWPEADLDVEPTPDRGGDHGSWPDEPDDPAPSEPATDTRDAPEARGTGPGPTPDAAGPTDVEAPGGPAGDEGPTAGISSPSSPRPPPDRLGTEFVCPECAETWPARNASLRPGDICPSCREGYLDEQVVQ